MSKLIIIGQQPPPYYGQSIMIQTLVKGLYKNFDVDFIPMQFSRQIKENGNFGFYKIFHMIILTFRILKRLRKHPNSTLYYPPAPPKKSTILRDWFILSFTRHAAKKIIFHFHAYGFSDFFDKNPSYRFFKKPFMKPDVSIVMGLSCRKDAEFILSKKIYEIPCGIDVSNFNQINNTKKISGRILFVGLHVESKGVLEILETAFELKKANLDFCIHTVGAWKDKKIKKKFFKRRANLRLENHVIYRGELLGKDLIKEYEEASIFFFPTFYEFETFGIVLIEAMASGLVIVASDWRGPSDVVKDEITGKICPVHDINHYALSLADLIIDNDKALSMGSKGKELANEKYTKDHFVKNMEKIFREK